MGIFSGFGAESQRPKLPQPDIESFGMAVLRKHFSREEVKSTKIESPWHSPEVSTTRKECLSFLEQIANVHSQLINWKEMDDEVFDLSDNPEDDEVFDLSKTWTSNPSTFKDVVSSYRMEAILENLRLYKDDIRNILGVQGQHMAVNYYPACPEPELTYGLPAHTGPNALTILLQDLQASGKRLAINPHPDAFVINIGDQIQAAESSSGNRKHGTTINSTEDDQGLEFKHSGLMATVATQTIAGALANRIAGSNANSSTVLGEHFIEVAIVLAVAFKVVAHAAPCRRRKKLSVWLAKIGDILTASAVILSLALYLPPLIASIAGVLAFLIVATAVALT